jgi:hypothetical protein
MRVTLLLLLLAAPALGETLYLQASDVNLRARASTRAKVVGKISIGAECALLGERKGWAELRCGAIQGYTLRKFLGDTPPDFDELLSRATEVEAAPKDRLQAASRAVALRPTDERARGALRDAFMLAELGLLRKLRDKGHTHDVKDIKCDVAALPACVDAHVAKRFAVEWVRTFHAGREFVTVVGQGETLRVARGSLKGGHVVVEAAGFYAAGSGLGAALAEGARRGAGKEPALDKESVKALEALAGRTWVPVAGTADAPRRVIECGYSSGSYAYELEVHDGLVATGAGTLDMIQDSNLLTVSRARKTGKRKVELTWRGIFGEGEEDAVLRLPAGPGKAARWTVGGGSGLYAAWVGGQDAEQAFPVEVDGCRRDGCPEGPTRTPELVGDWYPDGQDGWTFAADNTVSEMGPDPELGCWTFNRATQILKLETNSISGEFRVRDLKPNLSFTATKGDEVVHFRSEHD